MASPVADTPASTGHLQRIPLEILLRITDSLSVVDLGSCRLTCRSLEQGLYNSFVREFFTRKQFMISEFSLQTFIDISKSRLSDHLRMVHIGLDRFTEAAHYPQLDPEKEARFKKEYKNHWTMINLGRHNQLLAEAFRNLNNLDEVVIRDFNSPRRRKDSPSLPSEWTSYGANTFFAQTGVRPIQADYGSFRGNEGTTQYSSFVFEAVRYALAEAGARPKGIEFRCKNQKHAPQNNSHLRDYAFNVPDYIKPSVVPLLEGLEKLHLCVDFNWRNPRVGYTPTNLPAQPSADTSLREFLSYTKNLRSLRINESHGSSGALTEFLAWLATPTATSPVTPAATPDGASTTLVTPLATPSATPSAPATVVHAPTLPHLQELSLGVMNVRQSHILALARKFAPSLQSLLLHKITLVRDRPSDEVNGGTLPKTKFWTTFFEKLRDIPNLELHHLQLSYLQQQWSGLHESYRVNFKDTGHCPNRQYTGPDWRHFVKDMLPHVEVEWPVNPVSFGNHSDEDVDLEDDDDDDDGEDSQSGSDEEDEDE